MKTFRITSREELEEAAVNFGILPFFRNNIKGFSVEEMTAPGLLFGGNEFEGAWEWKGPTIRNHTTAYGKFFRRKAGFVSRELLPYFLTLRRAAYPLKTGSTEEMIYDIIDINDAITSTDLRESLIGARRHRTASDLPESPGSPAAITTGYMRLSRHTLEAPLQRLQMGGWICISDFRYKMTRHGERYGWGVAEYSVPENLFLREELQTDMSPEQCLDHIIETVGTKYPDATPELLRRLLT